ncbi:MAG: helix-turn-helix domain-containing protein [Bacteroidales bacterium]|jgi:transcriptional regulator with XRE-family HTH domain|nr:helix-turn-helix domain-containing protein [Bacteroidales bacterium]
MKTDYYEYSIPELVQLLGLRFKDYRMRSNMTQKDVAEQSGVTINTIHKFENGLVPNLSISTFLLLLKAIGCIDGLDELLPELPESLYLIKDNGKKAQRIRHSSKSKAL